MPTRYYHDMAGKLVPSDKDGVAATVVEDNGELDTLNRFLRLLEPMDERGVVLALAAFLEDALGSLLLAYFRDCKATRDLVEGFNAPLGTLSSRIKATYSFGLASEEQFKDMELLRKIRNLFAHDWEGVSFARNDISAMIGQLSCYSFLPERITGTPHQRLVGTLSHVCIELHFFALRIKDGKHHKAPDVSHRLSTVPPPAYEGERYV